MGPLSSNKSANLPGDRRSSLAALKGSRRLAGLGKSSILWKRASRTGLKGLSLPTKRTTWMPMLKRYLQKLLCFTIYKWIFACKLFWPGCWSILVRLDLRETPIKPAKQDRISAIEKWWNVYSNELYVEVCLLKWANTLEEKLLSPPISVI